MQDMNMMNDSDGNMSMRHKTTPADFLSLVIVPFIFDKLQMQVQQ